MNNKPRVKESSFKVLVTVGTSIIWIAIIIILNYLGANLSEYIAFTASFLTASIAILTKKRSEPPYLRITPILGQLFPLTHIELSMKLENLRGSIAKDIEIKCRLFPTSSQMQENQLYIKNGGLFKHKLAIANTDSPTTFLVAKAVDRTLLISQKFVYEISFCDINGKKYKQKEEEIPLREIVIELEKKVQEEKFPSPKAIYLNS